MKTTFLILLTIVLWSFVQPALAIDWRKQSCDTKGYVVEYPAEWVILKEYDDDFFVYPPEHKYQDTKTFLNLTVVDLSEDETKMELTDLQEKVLNRFASTSQEHGLRNFQVMDQCLTNVSDIPARFITSKGSYQEANMYYHHTLVRKDCRLYILVIGCLSDKYEELSTMISVAEGCFVIK